MGRELQPFWSKEDELPIGEGRKFVEEKVVSLGHEGRLKLAMEETSKDGWEEGSTTGTTFKKGGVDSLQIVIGRDGKGAKERALRLGKSDWVMVNREAQEATTHKGRRLMGLMDPKSYKAHRDPLPLSVEASLNK